MLICIPNQAISLAVGAIIGGVGALCRGMNRISPYRVVAFLLGVLYLLSASLNPSGDSLAYAADAMDGAAAVYPHHLLYGPLCHALVHLLPAMDALRLLQAMNALLGVGCLLLLGRIVLAVAECESAASSAVLLCGSCFGFMRFATDNEVYLLWVFFALMTVWYVLRFLDEGRVRYLLALSAAASLACLSHQLGILIWAPTLVLLFARRQFRSVVVYLAVSLSVPLTYVAFNGGVAGLMGFVLHDYVSGTAQGPVLSQVLLLTPISVVRTFVQVHASTLAFMHAHVVLFAALAAVLVIAVVVAVVALFPIRRRAADRGFAWYCASIALLVLAFAAYSNGNAEFMVLLPFMLMIVLCQVVQVRKSLLYASAGLLMWNLVFGLSMQRRPDLTTDSALVEFVHDHSQFGYDLADPVPIENLYHYRYYPDTMSRSASAIMLTDKFSPQAFTRHSLTHQSPSAASDSALLVATFSSYIGSRTLHRVR